MTMGETSLLLFIQSLLIYLSVAFLVFIIELHAYNREKQLLSGIHKKFLPFYCWENIVSVILIGLLFGLRYNTGEDYAMYLREFTSLQNTGRFVRKDFEPLFYAITWFFVKTGMHYSFYFAFWGAIQVIMIFIGLNSRKHLLPWIMILLVLGPFAYTWYGFMRQWTIACLGVAAFPLLSKRKFILYLVFVLLATLIHKSAFLLLFFIFVPFIKIEKSETKLLISIFIIATILGLWPIWFKLFKYCSFIFDWFGYEKYQYLLIKLYNGEFVFKHWGPIHIVTFLSEILMIYYYPQIRKKYSNDVLLPLFFTIAFIGVCYENLFMNTMFFMIRPCVYNYIFVIITLAYVFHYLKGSNSKKLLLFYVILSCSAVAIELLKGFFVLPGGLSKITYRFFFM